MARRERMHVNLKVGKAQAWPTMPSHVRGVRQGNASGHIERERGLHPDPEDRRFATGTAERSTGINPKARNPIDPRMPNLSPS
jgi:hypothetical protein